MTLTYPHNHDAIFQGLDLDGLEYSAVDADIVKQFNELIFQYPIAFFLPENPLRAVGRFEHRMDREDAPPICSHPYKKSPAEVRAIKTEIERMPKLQIALPNPCMFSVHPGSQTSGKRSTAISKICGGLSSPQQCDTKRSLPNPIHLKRTGFCKPRKSICKMKLGQWLLANSYSTVRSMNDEFLKLTFGMKTTKFEHCVCRLSAQVACFLCG